MNGRNDVKAARRSWSALVALLLSACGVARPHYSNTGMTSQAFTEAYRSTLTAKLRDHLHGRPLIERSAEGAETRVDDRLDRLPITVLAALAQAHDRRAQGAEHDVLVHDDRGRLWPVTVWSDLAGTITFEAGPSWSLPAAPPLDTVLTRLNNAPVRMIDGARWNDASRRAVVWAVDLLTAGEKRAVLNQSFVRSPERGLAGHHVRSGCAQSVVIYDPAIEHEDTLFFGSPQRPSPFAASVVLHELGHSLTYLPQLRAACHSQEAYAKASRLTAELNALVNRYNASSAREQARLAPALAALRSEHRQASLDNDAATADMRALEKSGGPVIAAYAQALAGRPAPTRYGETDLGESFADAFALHHLDPEALRRVVPEAAEWFARGGHLIAAEIRPD